MLHAEPRLLCQAPSSKRAARRMKMDNTCRTIRKFLKQLGYFVSNCTVKSLVRASIKLLDQTRFLVDLLMWAVSGVA